MKLTLPAKILTLLLAPAFLLSFTAAPDRANFGGEWKLNEGKSELGNFGRLAAKSVKVDQKADGITISKTGTNFQGEEVTTTETLTFDGKVSETTVFGNSKKKSTASWKDDQTLVISYTIAFERNGETTEIKGTETWTSKDGELTILTNSSSPRGENTTKAVYTK